MKFPKSQTMCACAIALAGALTGCGRNAAPALDVAVAAQARPHALADVSSQLQREAPRLLGPTPTLRCVVETTAGCLDFAVPADERPNLAGTTTASGNTLPERP